MNLKQLGYQNTHKTLDSIGSVVSFFGWVVVVLGGGIPILIGFVGLGSGNNIVGGLGGLSILYGIVGVLVGLLIVGNGQLLKTIGLIEKNTQLGYRINLQLLKRLSGETDEEDQDFEEWLERLKVVNSFVYNNNGEERIFEEFYQHDGFREGINEQWEERESENRTVDSEEDESPSETVTTRSYEEWITLVKERNPMIMLRHSRQEIFQMYKDGLDPDEVE